MPLNKESKLYIYIYIYIYMIKIIVKVDKSNTYNEFNGNISFFINRSI